ncbi:MAG: hypothetical protein ACI83P_002327 [Janthinobacterium sp.]|jgi:hypothetical protein
MAGNISGNAYALTVFSPIKDGYTEDEIAYADIIRSLLGDWNREENSPMALVPNTYLCRYFVLDDVVNQSLAGAGALDTRSDFLPFTPDAMRRNALPYQDHLKSRYLVFSSDFHAGPGADLDAYLRGMWDAMSVRIREIWAYCYGFEQVDNAGQFISYIKKCQLPAALYFVGANDDSLAEQLKALYLKQELARFATDNQGLDAATLRLRMQQFMQRVEPGNLAGPTWTAGQYRL